MVSNAAGHTVQLHGEDRDVGLVEWPAVFDGAPVEHLFEPSTGSWRGVAPPTQTDVQCNVVVRRDPGAWVDNLMRLGMGQLSMSVTTERGTRVLPVRLKEVAETDWHGMSPWNAHFGIVPIMFTTPRPLWLQPPVRAEHTGEGWLHVGQVGDMPVWPTIRIEGTFSSVRIRLTEEDEPQTLPMSPSGWVVRTRPQSVTNGDGLDYPGVVPFWPEPVENGMVEVIPTMSSFGYKVTIEHTPEMRKAW